MEKNLITGPAGLETSSFALCQKCSNNWRDECLVTKPQLVRTRNGFERCSHYFNEKIKLKTLTW
jgi:hypothetical protein